MSQILTNQVHICTSSLQTGIHVHHQVAHLTKSQFTTLNLSQPTRQIPILISKERDVPISTIQNQHLKTSLARPKLLLGFQIRIYVHQSNLTHLCLTHLHPMPRMTHVHLIPTTNFMMTFHMDLPLFGSLLMNYLPFYLKTRHNL